MTIFFDGREYARKKEEILKSKVDDLRKRGIIPKLTSIIIGNDAGSILYQNLKKKAAERIGAKLDILNFDEKTSVNEVVDIIEKLNVDPLVHGIMIQLPLPTKFKKDDKDTLINAITKEKDIDGLRKDSLFLHPTAKAVLEILNYAIEKIHMSSKTGQNKVCIVGATGMVGKPLTTELKNMKNNQNYKNTFVPYLCKYLRSNSFEILEVDIKTPKLSNITRSADVLISCTGVFEIIKKSMVKDGVILIDVGAPVGDINKRSFETASFVSPVPGGVGPVTICCLMENLISKLNWI